MALVPEDRPTPPARRWLRFSLKTAFVLLTLYCVWLAFVTCQARRQQKALARVQELHGMVAFAFELDSQGLDWKKNAKPLVPGWMRRAIGEDYFRCVSIINFDEASNPVDNDLQLLEVLPDLRQLTFSNRKKITDAGMVHLAGLTQLKVLVLDGTGVTGPGLRHLEALQQLEGLTFSHTQLTDDGLRHLAALPKLKWLLLNDTKISDDGLRQLTGLTFLESLELVNTAITDAGLKHLEGLPALKRILLRGTKTTREGRAALRKAIPGCYVRQ